MDGELIQLGPIFLTGKSYPEARRATGGQWQWRLRRVYRILHFHWSRKLGCPLGYNIQRLVEPYFRHLPLSDQSDKKVGPFVGSS